ncbi:hypothetical protein BXZ70DRAFT_938388 [Cristinia sonorae]|uniref:Inner centromere protein ARK-binding domain-containing protein n=1 Tax=Cristinia sonorae TaxID=1940300 RepID=A0A8K0XQ63_9AGAR|nr:hypothetical protein BXZ70DRAFT_938388 [Cristinia sonorae]
MDGSLQGEPGVLAWCNTVRLTMAQDPGRAFLDQQIQQQGFEFLDNYLNNVISHRKEESVYELLKTPGRKRTTQKRTRLHTSTASKIDPQRIISLEETVSSEKENSAPLNSFHKALLEAKEQAEDVLPPIPSHNREHEANLATEGATRPATLVAEASQVAMELDDQLPSDIEEGLIVPEVRAYDEDMESEAQSLADVEELEPVQVKELSMIAEDDEERSRLSVRPPTFDDLTDVTVPVRDADAVTTNATLTRKPSISQFVGLSAPSPLRKSMKLSRESTTGTLGAMLAHTPGTGLAGKRSSWLTKAKEVKALELNSAGKKHILPGEAGLSNATANKKRKSSEMFNHADVPVEEDPQRKQKTAKVADLIQGIAATRVIHQADATSEHLLSKPPPNSHKPITAATSAPSLFMDDFTIPLADVLEEEGSLDKLKRTVEGFGARSKSMGKSLGGNAAAALAEARAAAQARVAERRKEEEGEVTEASPEDSEGATKEHSPALTSTERRLSVSDLVSAAESKAKTSLGSRAENVADTSVSTTPPDSPRITSHPSQTPAPPPVFSKPPPVFVAPPPAVPPSPTSFKLPVGHPFALPPAMSLGVNSMLQPSGSSKGQPLSAQSSKASIYSDAIFDKEDDIPAWMPDTQDTEISLNPSIPYSQEKDLDPLDDDDSWRVEESEKPGQAWTPFGFTSADKDDTMTWTTAPSRSTSQKGGDTDRFQNTQYTQNMTDAFHTEPESQARGPFDFLPEDAKAVARSDQGMMDMSMDVDDDAPYADSEVEEVDFTGKSTVSLVQPQGTRSQSQQSMASTSSSQSQQLGFFGQATKLVSSVLGGGKKTKPEPVKSIQRAAVAAKKQQEEAEKKVTRLKEMEQRRQLALQRKAEDEKLRLQEEEKKLREEMEKRKREREDLTDKRPLRSTTKKPTEDDLTKKRKLTVESEKKVEAAKKPPPRDQPSRLGKPTASTMKIGPPLKSAMKQPATVGPSSLTAGPGSSASKEVRVMKTVASTSTLKSTTSSLKGKGKADYDDVDDPSQVVQTQMANRVKAQIQAAQTPREPPRIASESIELPEINSEYSDSEDEDRPKKFDPPNWAQSPELSKALEQQSKLNPDDIFGRIGPLRMEEIFRTRTSRFRARTSSANWSGADQLTAEEEKAYEKRMGYK